VDRLPSIETVRVLVAGAEAAGDTKLRVIYAASARAHLEAFDRELDGLEERLSAVEARIADEG
jgi:hypothetical protein